MRLEWYRDVSGFDALRAEWDELLQRSATDVPFLTWGWQRAWWNAFGAPLQGGKDLRLLAMWDDSEHLMGVVPLFIQETSLDPDAPLPDISVENPLVVANGQVHRTVHLVGGTEVSDYLDIIVPAESHQEVTTAFLDALAGDEAWQILDLRSLPSASPTVSAITELARARGWDVQQAREDLCPVLELPGTWEGYLTTKLNKKQRHELRRKIRRAERGARVDWYWVGADNLEQGMDVFIQLHKASALDKDAFMDERMEGFFRAVARFALEKDWLRLSVLRFNGQAVASYLCFDYGGDRLVYNSGFDLSTYRALSPGIVLLGYLIADAVERGCQRFDFLQGDERYKYDLGGTDTEVLRLFIRR
jgi:CelD/BcsL family acetyltransferase involved in cellulose biosynthesis